jgi:pimeloyl-ACP methyl ester carboxylesterase
MKDSMRSVVLPPSHPNPIHSYAEALERLAALESEYADEINPACRPQVLTHGRKVERSIVFLHGITNGPPQFHRLGRLFHDLGYNVVIPLMPRHGHADRLTDDQANLTAEELLAFTDQVVDALHGLGEHVTVAGLSLGGVLAAWCAQHRPDVDMAAMIAPAFAPFGVPAAVTGLVARLLRWRTNQFWWWHPGREGDFGPSHAYPRFSTHAVAELFRIGASVYSSAGVARPIVPSIRVVVNRRDLAVNNAATREIVRRWRRHGALDVRVHKFRDELPWLHDIVDPGLPGQHTDIVYPVLVDLLAGHTPPRQLS